MRPRYEIVALVCILAGILAFLAFRLASDARDDTPSDFLRFIDEGGNEGRLESAIVVYRGPDGVEVSLISVVHVGDTAYYDKLQGIFESYDALLYELIKDKDVDPGLTQSAPSLLGTMQRGLKNVLGLEFQLDAIDYSKDNFVHADMDPETFFRLQRDKGESMLTLMLRAMITQWQRQTQGEGTQLSIFHLLAALASEDRERNLKFLLAREFDEIEMMLAGFDASADEEGSVLLSGRNKVAVGTLRGEIQKGKKKIGVFYGAGHMPDLEKRLQRLGFRKVSETWLIAWDIRKKI